MRKKIRFYPQNSPNPKVQLLHLTEAEIEACMDTPIGKICILVSDKELQQPK